MLSRGNEHAFFHEACGVADPGDVPANRFDLEAVEIYAPEYDSRSRRRGQDSKLNRSSTVKPYAAALYRGADCLFQYQNLVPFSLSLRLQKVSWSTYVAN